MLLTITLLVLIGGLSAIIGSIVGIGGGIIIVPTMVYLGVEHRLLHNITTQVAIGTSSVILIVTGLSSSLGYLEKQNKLILKMVPSFYLDYYQVHCLGPSLVDI